MVKIIVNGANGRMGSMACETIEQHDQFELAATLGRNDNLAAAIKQHHADIVVDLTTPASVFENAKTIIDNGAHPVIGTSGLTAEQIKSLQTTCAEQKLGGIIAPNFAISAVLMMKFSQMAAQYFDYADIVEMHHEKKLDAPSGTAIKTAKMITEVHQYKSANCKASINGCLGANVNNISIHSARLPGLIANQTVTFGGLGQTLTIKQDSISRESFMPGIVLSCEKVTSLDHLVVGLEHVIN